MSMKSMRTASVTLYAAVAAAVLVSGCSSVKLDEKPPVETAKPAERLLPRRRRRRSRR
jgi:outer membrane murein-binding lipoprotein Lpp